MAAQVAAQVHQFLHKKLRNIFLVEDIRSFLRQPSPQGVLVRDEYEFRFRVPREEEFGLHCLDRFHVELYDVSTGR